MAGHLTASTALRAWLKTVVPGQTSFKIDIGLVQALCDEFSRAEADALHLAGIVGELAEGEVITDSAGRKVIAVSGDPESLIQRAKEA